MAWLVTGGAGYIGSHVVMAMRAASMTPVVLDDLSTGHRSFVPDDVTLHETTLLDRDGLAEALAQPDLSGVVHLAGFKFPGESVKRPVHTFRQNLEGTLNLLDAMTTAGVGKLVFSSSCSVYGTPDVDRVSESTPTRPESPYGESKLVGEWMIRDVAAATGLRQTCLRYFNVVGSGHPHIADVSAHNLFPLVLDALARGATPRVNGDDYPTPDGTCIRDYVHVADLADAHVAAARRLEEGVDLEEVYNLGSGTGLSVAEIMAAVRRVTGIEFTPEVGPRRAGDPSRIIADGSLAARDLGWRMRHTLDEMVETAWVAHQRRADAPS